MQFTLFIFLIINSLFSVVSRCRTCRFNKYHTDIHSKANFHGSNQITIKKVPASEVPNAQQEMKQFL
uniref:Uncharacterized protein n=1 Tax=Arundo donax TaxID=35708 RepID=A0A0A9EGW6_ARUDO